MAKRKESKPLQKVTLHLFEGDSARLQELYPRLGAAKVVRELVAVHLRKIDALAEQKLPPPEIQLD